MFYANEDCFFLMLDFVYLFFRLCLVEFVDFENLFRQIQKITEGIYYYIDDIPQTNQFNCAQQQ